MIYEFVTTNDFSLAWDDRSLSAGGSTKTTRPVSKSRELNWSHTQTHWKQKDIYVALVCRWRLTYFKYILWPLVTQTFAIPFILLLLSSNLPVDDVVWECEVVFCLRCGLYFFSVGRCDIKEAIRRTSLKIKLIVN